MKRNSLSGASLTRRSMSRHSSSGTGYPPERPPSPPSQTYHPSHIPRAIPTTALLESLAGASHYSGIRVDHDVTKPKPPHGERRPSHAEVSHDHERAMADLKELYCCRPTREIFERSWHIDAVFEDPLSKCKGFREYAAQWYALTKMCSKSETISQRVLSSTNVPNRLVFSQSQSYTFRLTKRPRVVNSIITVDFDDDEKIVKLVEIWDMDGPPKRFGAGILRRVNAKVIPLFVRIPKNDHAAAI